jgi:Flp pilus assembly secretin CpaC
LGIAKAFKKAGKMTGRALLQANREAGKLNSNLDQILGEERTRPGDGFNQDKVRRNTSMSSPRDSRSADKKTCAFGKKDQVQQRNFFSNTSNSRGYSRNILGESDSERIMSSEQDRNLF